MAARSATNGFDHLAQCDHDNQGVCGAVRGASNGISRRSMDYSCVSTANLNGFWNSSVTPSCAQAVGPKLPGNQSGPLQPKTG